MRKIKLLLSSFVFIIAAKSQDIHFSQFNSNPLTINPALTGVFNGDQRGVLNYKDQWTSFGEGYKTYSVSFDMRTMNNKWKNGCLGVGLNIFNDVAGSSKMSTTKALLSVSGIIDINKQHQFIAGIQGGMVQNSLNSSNLIWDDQYVNGSYNSNVSSLDYVNAEPFYYADMSAGISWNYVTGQSTISSYDATRIQAGVSYHHINRPTLEFRNNNTDVLYSKLIFHSTAHYGIKNSRLAIRPGLLVVVQGSSNEIVAGATLRYRMKESSRYTGYFSEQALSLGGHYRWNDAFIPSVWYEISNLAIGVSYDVNLSPLRAASNLKGGMEISLRFINPNPFTYQSRSKPSFN